MTAAKAVAAFVVAVLTALFASNLIPNGWNVPLGLLGAVATAIVTYAVPNRGTVTVVNRQ